MVCSGRDYLIPVIAKEVLILLGDEADDLRSLCAMSKRSERDARNRALFLKGFCIAVGDPKLLHDMREQPSKRKISPSPVDR